ncbi:MAG: DUF128 domain-containing protein, partial [Methanosarcinales archaeon]|nr:DUF128 domain-containing protein [Methanosarcinales archaeon]
RMTSVLDVLETGNGKLLANMREIPASAKEHAIEVLDKAKGIDIDGLIGISKPGNPIFKAPVSPGKIGLPIYAGLNCIVAMEESGIDVSVFPISRMANYKNMTRL